MNSGRMPACDTEPCLGANVNASGNEVLTGRDDSHKDATRQQFARGNRCGHRRDKVVLPMFLRKAAKRNKHPLSIEQAIKGVRNAVRWFRSSRKKRKGLYQTNKLDVQGVQSLERAVLLFSDERVRGLFFHDTETRASRKRQRRRSEGLESLVLFTLSALFNYVCLRTMAIGVRHDPRNFTFADYAYIANKTGCSETRIKRAMSILQKMGLVTVKNIIHTLDDGHIITLRTEIYLSEDAFYMLGLKDQFLSDREYAVQKYEQKIRAIEDKERRKEIFKPRPLSYQRQLQKDAKQQDTVQNLARTLKRPTTPLSPGHGVEIREKIKTLVDRGFSVSEAMEIVRQQSPPH